MNGLPTFPVPLFGAVLLAVLAYHEARRDGRRGPTLGLLVVLAAQMSLIALVQHYQLIALKPLQLVGALAIAPFVWCVFQDGVLRPLTARDVGRHALAPVAIAVLALLRPAILDVWIPLGFVGYGTAMLATLHRRDATLPEARLGSGPLPARLWTTMAITLLVSGAADFAIVLDQALLSGSAKPWIITIASSLSLLLAGVLATGRDAVAPERVESGDTPAPDDTYERDALLAALERLMLEQQPWRDPDLSLTRLARRLGVPDKRLSAAINAGHGENVSRYVNHRRIQHACERLAAGDRITDAMLAAGFATKSNFNREFRRVTGMTPSAWREGQRDRSSG